ncbi:hypothetical protein CTI12_AA519610 [Artemisia annua]|uniref:Uncharacterized protein n=1 Tax=Artemisia annua TaxID=35608 RepID=A0A2U1L871_ARTAN|nr:hypothetical protein CTI12_AA519610 [Artemisia annua]
MDHVSLPSFYLSAPTSPGCRSPDNGQYYSTWSGPLQQVGYGSFGYESYTDKTDEDQFEFKFNTKEEEHQYRLPARANSFSTLTFADELFCNGRVLPLKLPPRLQTSVPTSPKSFSSRVRSPFAQRCTWNDGFDPFLIALEKVSEETDGRVSVHRRSRSYSPFRGRSFSRKVDCTKDWDYGQEKGPAITKSMEPKGSSYSRWVRSQTMVTRPKARTTIKKLWLGRRVRDADFSHNQPVKPMKQSDSTSGKESKMQKVKSVLFRYASLKKETSESNQSREIVTISKISYFKRLSLSLKTNRRKKESWLL